MLQTIYGFWKNSLKSAPSASTSHNAATGLLFPPLSRNGFGRVPGFGIDLVDGDSTVTLYRPWTPSELPDPLVAAAHAPHAVNDGRLHLDDPVQRSSAQSVAPPALAANPALETHVQGLVSAMAAFSAPPIGSAALGETIGTPWFMPVLTVDGTT